MSSAQQNTANTSSEISEHESETLNPKRRFIILYVLAYGGGFIGIFGPAILSLYTRLTDVFPSEVDGLLSPVSALAIVSGIGAIAAALANPFIGRLSDRTTSRWGMRRPWLAISSLIFTAGILLVAFGPGHIVTLTLGWVLAQGGFNGMLAIYTAILPDQIPERLRGRVAASLGIAQNVASLAAVWLIGLFAAGTIEFSDLGVITGGNPSSPLRFLVPLAIALITAFALFVVLAPLDRRLDRSQVPTYSAGEFFGSFVFNPKKNPDFSWAWISRFFFMLGIAYLLVYQAPYSEIHLGFTGSELDDVVLWGTIATVSGVVITGYLAGKLSDIFHRRKIFVIFSALLYAISLLFLTFATPDHSGLPIALIGLFIGGLAQGIYFGIDLALVTDVLPDKKADAAKDLGVFNIASAGPQFMAPFIAPLFLGMTLFNGSGTSQDNFSALFFFAAIFSTIGALLVLPIKKVK
ncbi:MFS transporter [Lysinibacter sp. HNR]|uniref:MFS transporter n=1 Tax=Lysinibacter sp. HNR TaxID=3031408 RepID=UPI002435B842|nr:MFS transporter [Lysinibacter sp. HNR]WGD36770.1 MFS transporter [Lysinibacter sp. HNR]